MNTIDIVGVMKAYVLGKRVQRKPIHEVGCEWIDTPHPIWNWSSFIYRVAPDQSNKSDFTEFKLMTNKDGKICGVQWKYKDEDLWVDWEPKDIIGLPKGDE